MKRRLVKEYIVPTAEIYSVKAEIGFADRAASTYDNVHPNVAGMKEMADQIWEQVKSYI